MEVKRAVFNNMTLREYLNCFTFRQSLLPFYIWSNTVLTLIVLHLSPAFSSAGYKNPIPRNWRSGLTPENSESGENRESQRVFSVPRECLEPQHSLSIYSVPQSIPFSISKVSISQVSPFFSPMLKVTLFPSKGNFPSCIVISFLRSLLQDVTSLGLSGSPSPCPTLFPSLACQLPFPPPLSLSAPRSQE